MTSRKRRSSFGDDGLADVTYGGGSKFLKVEQDSETSRSQSNSFPTILLSGFTWNEHVDLRMSRVMEPYHPVLMEASTELPAHERLEIQWKCDIETDFVRIECATQEDQERVIRDLHHARFTWTQPYLNVQRWENSSCETIGTQPSPTQRKQWPIVKLPPSTSQQKREIQSKVWIKLSEALNNARAELKGDDLDTFEALVAKPVPGNDPMERVNRWIRGSEEPEVRYQKPNTGVQRVKVERESPTKFGKENVRMEDEMAERGANFGMTDSEPW